MTRRSDHSAGTGWTKFAATLALGALAIGCMFDGDLKHDTGTVPEVLDDGWVIDTPENVGLSPSVLADIHDQLLQEDHYRGALSFLVVKDGKLVFETYLRRRSDQTQHGHVQSVTKSVTSLLFGIARDQGHVESLDLTVGELFPDEVRGVGSEEQKKTIRLHDFLTMRSGLEFDNSHFSVEMWVTQPDDPVRYMLSKAMYAAPGAKFYYRDTDPQLVGYAMTDLTGKTELELAQDTLFRSLDIDDYLWESGPDGITMAAHGLRLLPRDLAKLGLLVLNRGIWHGERVVSEEWIDEATSPKVDSEVQHGGGVLPYGFYFWVVPGVGFSMWGHGGQFVLIVPSRALVLVQTAFPDSDLPDSDLPAFLGLVAPLLPHD